MRCCWLLIALFFSTSVQAATGRIKVDVSNAPGEIRLDGMPTDQTAPAILDAVSPGEHVVELEYGCLKGKAQVTVRSGAMTTAKIRMKNKGGKGTVRLRGLPRLAKVFVDDAPVKQDSNGIILSCGGHRIRTEAEGFADWEEMVIVTTDRWTTASVHMVEVEIEEDERPSRRAELSVDEDLDDLDDLDFLEEDLIAREKAINEREQRLAKAESQRLADAKKAEDDRRKAAAQARAKKKAEARRNRYGDVDSLDEESPDISTPSREKAREDLDELDEDDELMEEDDGLLGVGRSPKESSAQPKERNTGLIAGLSTAALGAGGMIYGLVAHSDYKHHEEQWSLIAMQSGSPSSPEATNYGETFMNPAKARRNLALGVSSALLLGGSGWSAWTYFGPTTKDATPPLQPRDELDELDELDLFMPKFGIQVRYSSAW